MSVITCDRYLKRDIQELFVPSLQQDRFISRYIWFVKIADIKPWIKTPRGGSVKRARHILKLIKVSSPLADLHLAPRFPLLPHKEGVGTRTPFLPYSVSGRGEGGGGAHGHSLPRSLARLRATTTHSIREERIWCDFTGFSSLRGSRSGRRAGRPGALLARIEDDVSVYTALERDEKKNLFAGLIKICALLSKAAMLINKHFYVRKFEMLFFKEWHPITVIRNQFLWFQHLEFSWTIHWWKFLTR